MSRRPLGWRLLAEFLGTGVLVAVVIGSGIMAQSLSPHDIGLELVENTIATVAGLVVLIYMFGPVSGAHFNPVVSVADWVLGRRSRSGLTLREVAAYIPAQIAGAIGGAVLANLMFALPAITMSQKFRPGGHRVLGEVVATAGLVALIFALSRSQQAKAIPAAVGLWIGSAYWATSSTSFANPAVTIGRTFSNTFAGIAAGSVPGFIVGQLIGGAIGCALVVGLYPGNAREVARSAGSAAGGEPAATPALPADGDRAAAGHEHSSAAL